MKPSPSNILEKGVWAAGAPEKAKDVIRIFLWWTILSLMLSHFEKLLGPCLGLWLLLKFQGANEAVKIDQK